MPVRIFISYSHNDSQYLSDNSLLGFLKGLDKEGAEFWWDDKIAGGEKWDDEIRANLKETNIALVLVSQRFLDSSYCTQTEIDSFLKSAGEGKLVIIPIILSACDWERHYWLSSRQAFPGNHETLEENYTEPGKLKRLFAKIRDSLRKHIETKPVSNLPKTNLAEGFIGDFSKLGEKKLFNDDFSLVNIFNKTDTPENNNKDEVKSWSDYLTNKAVSADSIPTLTGYIAMKLDWDLDAYDSCNGLLTRDKLDKVIKMLHKERDKLIFEQSSTVYVSGRLQNAKQYLEEMEKRNIDALDYMPEQLKNLPDYLKPVACEILLNYRDWSSQITQEKIDDAKYRLIRNREISQQDKDRILTQIKEIAKTLNFIG